MGLFKDWGVTNIDLKRTVRRKITGKNKLKKRSESADYTGRKYDDYVEFVKNNPTYATAEMDTVYNHQEGPYIQTFIFENTRFMIGRLKQDKLDLMFSHINSVPRKSLGEKTPYEAFEFFYGKEPLEKFNIQKIKEDEVTLQPYLLNL